MEKDVLSALVDADLTVREIAAKTGKGYSTVRYWLRKHGLATKHRGPGRASRLEAGERLCVRHGAVRFVKDSHGIRCSKCRSEQVSRRRRRVKEILVEEAGGCCVVCGYDRYIGALEFHHRDPSTKSFHLGLGGLTRSLEKMRAEASKCSLVCSNCHAEIEGGVVMLV
jgi:DNA-binding transcriptional ArsR family regulator